MIPDVVERKILQLAARSIVNYLGGDLDKYKRLVEKAMIINGMTTCPECRAAMVFGRMGAKGRMKDIMLCTTCGYVKEHKKGDESYAGENSFGFDRFHCRGIHRDNNFFIDDCCKNR